MRLVHCDNASNCDTAVDENEHERSMKWITAFRGSGTGAPHSMGPWHLCSWECAEQFFATKKGTH